MSESALSDDLGRQGEIEFDRIANKAGLLVGKIDPDRVGKDRHVEAKIPPRAEHLPFDQRPAPLSCGIQIKSVLQDTKVVTLALSVAERLAQSVEPAFICVVRLDNDLDFVEMRLIHLLDQNLEKILKRLREEFARGTIDLHKKTVSFTVKSAKKIGRKRIDLTQSLWDAIGPDMDAYAAEKARQKKTVGFISNAHLQVEGVIDGVGVEEIVDGLLGLRPMRLSKFDVLEERFGIKLPHPRLGNLATGGTAFFDPKPAAECTLIVGEPSSKEAITFPCSAILPAVPNIPMEHFKARLSSKYLEAIFTATTIDFTSADGWEVDSAQTLDDWITYFKIVAALEEPDCQLTLRGQGRPDILGKASLNAGYQVGEAKGLIQLLEAYRVIRSEAGGANGPISLRVVYERYAEIMKVYNIFRGSPITSDLSFTTIAAEVEENKPIGLIFVSMLEVGTERFAYAMRCEVKATSENGGLRWKQVSPMLYLDAQKISADNEIVSYQRRMMRVSRSQLSVSDTFEEAEFAEED